MTSSQLQKFVESVVFAWVVIMILGLMFCGQAHGQVSVAISPYPRPQFLSPTAVPLAGGSIKTYSAGTTTPLATYADYQGNTQNATTITLDSGGFPEAQGGGPTNIFLAANTYKFCAFDSLGVQQWCVDGVADIGQILKANLAASGGSGLVGFLQQGALALTNETVQSKLRQVIDAGDFQGATANAKITNAIAALNVLGGIVTTYGLTGTQPWAACPTFGSLPVTLALSASTIAVAVNCTIPANVTLHLDGSGTIGPAVATTLTISGGIVAPAQQVFTQAGTIALTGAATSKVLPQWFPGADAGVQTSAAIAALPTTGGNIDMTQYATPLAASTITLGKAAQVFLPCGNVTNVTFSATSKALWGLTGCAGAGTYLVGPGGTSSVFSVTDSANWTVRSVNIRGNATTGDIVHLESSGGNTCQVANGSFYDVSISDYNAAGVQTAVAGVTGIHIKGAACNMTFDNLQLTGPVSNCTTGAGAGTSIGVVIEGTNSLTNPFKGGGIQKFNVGISNKETGLEGGFTLEGQTAFTCNKTTDLDLWSNTENVKIGSAYTESLGSFIRFTAGGSAADGCVYVSAVEATQTTTTPLIDGTLGSPKCLMVSGINVASTRKVFLSNNTGGSGGVHTFMGNWFHTSTPFDYSGDNTSRLKTINNWSSVYGGPLPDEPRSRAYNSVAQAITGAGADNFILFDTNDTATPEWAWGQTIHSTSVNTSRFTIPNGGAGLWNVSCQLWWATIFSGTHAAVIRQTYAAGGTLNVGASEFGSPGNTVNAIVQQVSSNDIAALPGDYFELVAVQDSGAPVNTLGGANGTLCSIKRSN